MSEKLGRVLRKNLYIADWHFGHANVIAYDNRPFKTKEEMNAALVERWNSAVGPEDTVYVLGDMFCRVKTKEAVSVLRGLTGRKVLIRGNHDYLAKHRGVYNEFEQIMDYFELEDGWQTVVLCHYPIPCFHHHFLEDWCHLYGHVHNSFEWNMTERFKTAMEELGHNCQMYNAGAMMPWMDYTPRTLDDIISGAERFRTRMASFERKREEQGAGQGAGDCFSE